MPAEGTDERALRPRIVLIILCDALRYSSLIYAIDRVPQLVPALAHLRNRGIVFERCFSLTNTTIPSITSILTGLHPLETHVLNHPPKLTGYEARRLSRLRPVTAILRKLGYYSMYVGVFREFEPMFDIVVDPSQRGLSRKLFEWEVRRLGIDVVESLSIGIKFVKRLGAALSLSDVLNLPPRDPYAYALLALRLIDRAIAHSSRVLAFIHLLATHTPYYIVGSARREIAQRLVLENRRELMRSVKDLILERIRGGPWLRRLWLLSRFQRFKCVLDIVASYISAIVAVDRAVAAILRYLEERGLLDQSLILLLADHGESLYEHDIVMDHHGLYSTTTRVPLIVLFEGEGMYRDTRRDPATLIDVAPTLASIVGTRFVPSGIDLVSREAPEDRVIDIVECFVQQRAAVVWRDLRLIKAPRGRSAVCRYCLRVHGSAIELYDDARDPEERVNLFDPGVKEHRALLDRARRLEARLRAVLGLSRAMDRRTR